MKRFYFSSFFCFYIQILIYNLVLPADTSCLIINGENICHVSCETCTQCGKSDSCTSCRSGEFKISADYYDEVFACSSNCTTFSKEIHGKNYLYCTPSKIPQNVTENLDLQKTSFSRQAVYDSNFDTVFVIIICVSVIIMLIVCFAGIATICYCQILLKKEMNSACSAGTVTTDAESARGSKNSNEPLLNPPPQRRINNVMVYNNLEILTADNYKLGEMIGGGSYSRVYEGEIDGKPVAIKMALREGRKSIHKELQIYDKVSHAHILPALGVSLAVENLLFMPLRKFNLADYFIDYGAIITVDRLLRYCIQISSAVKYLHEREILHCDLKIDNILVKDDDGEQLEISDFGCAIDLSHDREARYNGTVTHTAYELLKDYINPDVKPRGTKASDVWAFAVTAWQIYSKSNKIPNDFVTPEEIIANYASGKKLPKPKDMPDRMWRYLIMQCFDLQPQGRPTMKEIYERLTTQAF